MLYKHKNLTSGTFGIKDSKGNCHDLKPGEELILDRSTEWVGRISVEKIEEEKRPKKIKKIKETEIKMEEYDKLEGVGD